MQKEYLSQLKKELKEIKKEGELVDINIEKEEDIETREINYPINRKIKKGIIGAAAALALATGLSVVPNKVPEQVQVVEAASKDKKKPTFKMSGKTTINIEKGKMVQVPKVTAKDNKDGNVTKKITVTVKKGSKSYSSIAKKIKNNKKVKFTEAGKYTITYTVKDKAGNKATKKRYMVVTEPISTYDEKDTEENTTENKTTEEKTTETTTTEQKTEATTEKPTTEQTTETPTKPEEPIVDLSKYADITQVTVNGYTYNLTTNVYEEYVSTESYQKEVTYDGINEGQNTAGSVGFIFGNNSPLNDIPYKWLYFLKKIHFKLDGKDVTDRGLFLYVDDINNPGWAVVYCINDEGKAVESHTTIYSWQGDFEQAYEKVIEPFANFVGDYSIDEENEFAVIPKIKDGTYEISNKKLVMKVVDIE